MKHENRNMMAFLSDALMLLDLESGYVEYMNPACHRFLNIPKDDVSLQKIETLFLGENPNEWENGKEYEGVLVQGKHVAISCTIQSWNVPNHKNKKYCMLHSLEEVISATQFPLVLAAYPEPTFIILLETGLPVAYGNEAFYRFFNDEEYVFCDVFDGKFINTIEPQYRTGYIDQVKDQFYKLGGFCLDIEVRDAKGKQHFVSFSGTLIPSASGTPKKAYCRLHSTDEKHKLVSALENEKFFFQTIQSLSEDLIFRYFIQENAIEYYGALRETLGLEKRYENYPPSILQEHIIFDQDSEDFIEMIRKMNAGQDGIGYYRAYDQAGQTLWLKKEWHVLCDADNNALEVMGKISNIQNQKEMEAQINVDSLTGCLRKQAFETLASQELSNAPNNEHAIMIVDLDNFKAINDNLGHHFGDLVLEDVGKKVRSLFRATDLVGRIGGDEFMIFLRNTASIDIITEKANALLQALDLKFQGDSSREYHISASIGVATYPKHGSSFQELYDHADIAMFDVKNRGRNNFACYEETLSKGTMENTTPYEVASRAMSQHYDAEILSQTFNLLFETKEFDISINSVLRILGKRFDVSRVYIFEASKQTPDSYDNTYEWCHDEVDAAISLCQGIPKETFALLMKQGNEDGIIYCNNVDILEDEIREVLNPQMIKSFLHAYIYSGKDVLYAIGFDDCSKERIWSPIEISTLLNVSKIIAQFLNYKKVLSDIQIVSEERLSVINSFNYFSYIVDQETFELRYFNAYTQEKIPDIKLGDLCYKTLRGLHAECPDCPLRQMRQNNTNAIRLVLKDTNMGKHLLVNASILASFGGRKSMFVAANNISDVIHLIQE